MAYFDSEKKPVLVNISMVGIMKVLLVLFLLYFIYMISDILMILFVSLVLASLITPWVDWMHKKRIPRGVGVILIYLVLFAILSLVIYLMIPPISEQVGEFSKNMPKYLDKVVSGIDVFREEAANVGLLDNFQKGLNNVTSSLQGTVGDVFTTVSNIFGGLVSLLLVLVITFYMVAEDNAMKKIIWSVVPEKHQPYIIQLLSRMQKKVSLWLRGQIILSIIMFVVTYIGLLILGVRYPLVLALIAGITEFIPYLGPIIAAVPALFIAFVQSPWLALFVLILYYVIQLIESNVIVPKLMHKVVGLNPIIIIVVLLVGFKVAGVVGAILAIPVATAATVFIKDVFEKRKAAEA
ncbi:AI-2E family transporter [Candidatus Falkowbacteria bacterium]|nr:AI-2E family transporter [Candidatus Falkowbacteria bacterium]